MGINTFWVSGQSILYLPPTTFHATPVKLHYMHTCYIYMRASVCASECVHSILNFR